MLNCSSVSRTRVAPSSVRVEASEGVNNTRGASNCSSCVTAAGESGLPVPTAASNTPSIALSAHRRPLRSMTNRRGNSGPSPSGDSASGNTTPHPNDGNAVRVRR